MTTSIKTCIKCKEQKCRSEFYVHSGMADGHLGKCKDCCREAAKETRNRNVDHWREHDRRRGNRQKPGYTKDWRSRYPKKWAAHVLVSNAIRGGKLVRGVCEVCNSGNVHAHHDDYDKPMEVRWLCPVHHSEWHSRNGEAKNAS